MTLGDIQVKKHEDHIVIKFGSDYPDMESFYNYATTLQELNNYKTVVVVTNNGTLILNGRDKRLNTNRIGEVLEDYE